MAILLPAVGRARDMSRQVGCSSNLRQLMQAVRMYSIDNDGYIPFPNDDSKAASWKAPGWLYDEGKNKPTKQEQVKQGTIWKYIQTDAVYHCPADLPPYRGLNNGRNSHELTSYMMNWAAGEFGREVQIKFTQVPAFQLARMPNDGICFWEADETIANADMWSDGTNTPANGLTARHGRGAAMARFDGGVTYMLRVDFNSAAASTGRNELWCNPNRTDGH